MLPGAVTSCNALAQKRWELKKKVTVLMANWQASNCATRLVALGIRLQDAVCKPYANQKLLVQQLLKWVECGTSGHAEGVNQKTKHSWSNRRS